MKFKSKKQKTGKSNRQVPFKYQFLTLNVQTKKGYRKRIIDERIAEYLNSIGAVCIEGPKGCGKTWSSLNCCKSATMLGDPKNNFNTLKRVELNISTAFEGEEPHLIDEWQTVPEIWDAVKYEVDARARKGSFVLTGSSTPVYKGILHSGTNRIARVKMRTMSLFETGDSDGSVSLKSLFRNSPLGSSVNDVSLNSLAYYIVRGGWPTHIGLSGKMCELNMASFVNTSVEDASKIDGRYRNRDKLLMTLRSLARNESTMTSVACIRKDIGEISESSVSEYIDAFERIFLIENQEPFDPNVRSGIRIGKTAKRHLTDPSISVAALGMNETSLIEDPETFGFMFESMCERDLAVYADANYGKLMHYRDSSNLEIDAIVELSGGKYGAFEIKLGAKQIDSACANLKRFESKMDGIGRRPEFLCVICGMCDGAYRRDDGIYVVPITQLSP